MYLLQTGSGRLELVNGLNQERQRMRTGEQYFIQYRLDFPMQSPLPTVKSITVNNQQICRGSKPSKCTDIIHVQSLPITDLKYCMSAIESPPSWGRSWEFISPPGGK